MPRTDAQQVIFVRELKERAKEIEVPLRYFMKYSDRDRSLNDIENRAINDFEKYKQKKENINVRLQVLPEGSEEVDIPAYYAVENKRTKKDGTEKISYRLVNPLTKQRNIAERKGAKPIRLLRKDIINVQVNKLKAKKIPLNQIVEKDRNKARLYDESRRAYNDSQTSAKDRDTIELAQGKERGRPQHLPKNIAWHTAKGTSRPPRTPEPNLDLGDYQDDPPDAQQFDNSPEARRIRLAEIRRRREPEETKEETRQEEEKEEERPAFSLTKKSQIDHAKKSDLLEALRPHFSQAQFDKLSKESLPVIKGVAFLKGGFGITASTRKELKPKADSVDKFPLVEEYFRNISGNGMIRGKGKMMNILQGGLQGRTEDFKKTVTAVITGATDYSPNVRTMIQKNGNSPVREMTVGRTPVQEAITSAINMISQGGFKANQEKLNYDKLFHLFVNLRLENGAKIRLEKNEVITASDGWTKEASGEYVSINVSHNIPFKELLENTRSRMGNRFFKYDSASNNCQDFILNVLQANNLGTEQDYAFIKQDTEALFVGLDKTRALARNVTDFGARFNIATQGGGTHIDINSHNGKNYKMSDGGKIISRKSMYMKGSPEAKAYMASIRKMRGGAVSEDLKESAGYNTERILDAGTSKAIEKMNLKGGNVSQKLKQSAGYNTGRLMDAGTQKIIEKMNLKGGAVSESLKQSAGYNTGRLMDAGTTKAIDRMNLDESGSGMSYGGGMGYGVTIHQHHHHHYGEGGTVNRINKYKRATEALGDTYQGFAHALKPVAKPLFQAITDRAVEEINPETPEDYFNNYVGMGLFAGQGMKRKGRFAKGSQEAKDYMASIRRKK